MGAIYFIYALANIYDEKEVKKYAALCSLPSILYVLLVFSNFYTSLLFSFDQVFCQSSGISFKKNRVFATGDMGQDDLL